jgi:hypothetical protein
MDDYLVSVLSNIGIISFVALSAYLLWGFQPIFMKAVAHVPASEINWITVVVDVSGYGGTGPGDRLGCSVSHSRRRITCGVL